MYNAIEMTERIEECGGCASQDESVHDPKTARDLTEVPLYFKCIINVLGDVDMGVVPTNYETFSQLFHGVSTWSTDSLCMWSYIGENVSKAWLPPTWRNVPSMSRLNASSVQGSLRLSSKPQHRQNVHMRSSFLGQIHLR